MMDDGIYLIERTDAVSIGAAKTLVCPAYNHAEAKMRMSSAREEFLPSFSKLIGSIGGWAWVRDYSPFVGGRQHRYPTNDFWSEAFLIAHTDSDPALPYEPFAGKGHLAYLTAYNTKGHGETFFSFDSWNFTTYNIGEEEIWFEVINVEIFAYVRGAAKIFMKVWDYPTVTDYDVYYGTETNDGFVFDWISESYPTNPRTGLPWTHYDVILDMIPGIWLKSGDSTATEYRKPGAACKEFYCKITIRDPLGTHPDEIRYQYPDFAWGDNTAGLNDPYIASCLYGGLGEWDDYYTYPMSATHTIEEPQNIYDTKIREAPPGADAINSLAVSITLDDLPAINEFKLWVKVGATYYYGAAFNPSASADTTHSDTWSVNPATSAAWTRAELLAARIGCYCVTDPAPDELMVGIWDFHAVISYGSPAINFVPACIAAGGEIYDFYGSNADPILFVPAIPRLEAYVCQSGPHEFGASRRTTLNLMNSRYFTYPVTDLPPIGSTIRYVKVYHTIGAAGVNGAGYNITYKPHVEFPQKEYYFGTPGTIYANGIQAEGSYTWNTNPKTGVTWTRDDLIDLCFGVHIQHTDCDPDDPYGDEYYRNSQIYGLECEIGYGTSDTITTDASDNQLWGDPILYTCDLTELPPRGSTIDSITIDYGFSGTIDEAIVSSCSMAAWICVDGVYYFDEDVEIGDPFYEGIGSVTWNTNPATSAAWTYEDLTHLKWGAILRNGNTSGTRYTAMGRIHELELSIDYNEAALLPPTYHKLAIGEVLYWDQEWNPITDPDILKFATNIELSERQELAMFHEGLQIFHGIVLSREKAGADRYIITAKLQSVMLQYRYIPMYSYAPEPDAFEEVLTIRDMFSADLPTYPFSQNTARQHFTDTIGYNYPGIEMTDCRQSRLGILWLINSMIPPGVGVSHNSVIAKWAGFGGIARQRCIMTTNHCPSPLPNGFSEALLYTMSPPTINVYTAGEWQTKADYIGGVHRLAIGSNANLLKPGEAYVDGDDLYVNTGGMPDVVLLCIDNYYDTYLRPGEWDLADSWLNVANSFQGRADESFADFFDRLGQEVRFRNADDGYVYIDAATEISRGSDTSPIKRYVHGENCLIIVKEDNDGLQPNAHVSLNGSGMATTETDWSRPYSVWINSLNVDSSRSDEDLAAWLAIQHTYDKTKYEITYIGKDYLLRKGDWIWVTPKDYPAKAVRIRSVTVQNGKTKIVAGLNPNTINATYGAWRNAKGTVDITKKYQSLETSFTGAGPNTATFAVLKDQCTDWMARLTVSIQAVDGQIEQDMVLRVLVNSIIVGRWKINGTSNAVEFDISAMCSKSTTTDTDNTVTIYLHGGTSDYTTTYTVDQYKILKELSNA